MGGFGTESASQSVAIGGIKTDSSEELPYKVECLTKAGEWEVVKENCRGSTRLDSTVMARAVKLSWMDTGYAQVRGVMHHAQRRRNSCGGLVGGLGWRFSLVRIRE